MAPRKQRANSPEFPVLEANALYAGEIRGDGNCLFNALSDQLYGHQEMHEVLRTATIEHMRDNSDFYRQYMAVNNVRRNPKRKTTSTMPTRIDTTYFTEEQLQQQFEEHVEKMGQPGEWADNMEVSAFASALNVHVRLWQADYTYLFSPRVLYAPSDDPTAADDRQTLHIAYHTWEHYSSVRKLAGPHTGLPDVHIIPEVISKKRPSPSVDGDDDDQRRRARKRRSPLPLFDSDSTPEGTESSSDESNGFMASQQSRVDIPPPERIVKPQKLTIKLRGLRTTDLTDSPISSRTSSPAPAPAPASPPLRPHTSPSTMNQAPKTIPTSPVQSSATPSTLNKTTLTISMSPLRSPTTPTTMTKTPTTQPASPLHSPTACSMTNEKTPTTMPTPPLPPLTPPTTMSKTPTALPTP